MSSPHLRAGAAKPANSKAAAMPIIYLGCIIRAILRPARFVIRESGEGAAFGGRHGRV